MLNPNEDFGFFFTGTLALLFFLYSTKTAVLTFVQSEIQASWYFAVAAIACIPVTWAISPDWNNPHYERIAVYVGNPILTLTVPCMSFLVDLFQRRRGRLTGGVLRLLFELMILFPLWSITWVFVEFFVMGWIWI